MDKEEFIYWLARKDNDFRTHNTTDPNNKNFILNSNFKLIERMLNTVLVCLKENKLQTTNYNLFFLQFCHYVYCNSTK